MEGPAEGSSKLNVDSRWSRYHAAPNVSDEMRRDEEYKSGLK